jgi:VCBS repeat protein/centrosomal CEP192-like protein
VIVIDCQSSEGGAAFFAPSRARPPKLYCVDTTDLVDKILTPHTPNFSLLRQSDRIGPSTWRTRVGGTVRNYFVLGLFSLCLLCGCGGSNSTQQPPPPPAPATHFSVAAQATATAGIAVNFTVNALDASNNLVTTYSGTVHFSSSDGQAALPGDQPLTNGTASLQITFFTGGNQTITATDTVSSSITGSSPAINVKVLTTTHFSVSAPATASTGTAFNFAVTALDASNNQVPTYAGAVHFTSTDGQAILPSDQGLASGTGTFTATLKTSGNQTITATDSVTASITGTSAAINDKGATHFSVSAPANATSGSAFDLTVNALDDTNNVVAGYAGTVSFSSSDTHADLPPTQMMTTGTQTFPAALKTAGSQTIKVTDTVTAIVGTSGTINVSAAAAANPVPFIAQPLSPDAVTPGGAGFPLTVNGTGFVVGSTVKWNGSARATTFVSKSQLTATILVSDIATPNTASVTVTNPGPGGGTSNVVFFHTTLPTSAVAFGTSALNFSQNPYGMATADFNGDGKLDLVVADNSGNAVSVLLGKGDGTFQAPVNYTVGTSPTAVAVGDFNGDGKLDLAVGSSAVNGGQVNILLGNGDGTFQSAKNFSVTCCPSSVAVGDFNGDGKLDLVMATSSASVLLGNGDGTFQTVLDYPAGSYPATIAVGDFSGDGLLDLAVVDNGNGNVDILLGNGDGTFQSALDFAVGSVPFAVVAGDFNGDGILDLAVANVFSSTVSVLLGNGNGTFQSAMNYDTGGYPNELVMEDFNGDGKLDLAVGSYLTQILFGKGDGTFEPAATYASQPGAPNLNAVAAGDFTGQGRLDLVVGTGNSNAVEFVQSTLAPSANSLNFPVQLLQMNSTQQTVTLTNVSAQLISISSIAITGANATEFVPTETCGSSLAPGAMCMVSITFTPTQMGPRTAAITITDSAVGSPQSIALNGIGVVSGPNATLSTASLSITCRLVCRLGCFCLCTSTPRQPITLSDFGNADLSISGMTVNAPFRESNTCNGSLTTGNSCTIGVGFRKTTPGTVTGTLDINDNAPGSPHVVNLTGTMQSPACQ